MTIYDNYAIIKIGKNYQHPTEPCIMKKHAVDIPATPPELTFAGIARQYEEYQHVRDMLHDPLISATERHELFIEADELKTNLADASSDAYRAIQQTRPDDVGRIFNFMLVNTITNGTEDRGKQFCTEYARPISPLHLDHTSPVESIVATTDNKAIAREFARVADASPLTGLLVSGANAWGAFYSVHGGRHPILDKYGVPFTREFDRQSDIDMLAIAPEIDDIGQAIEQYIAAGLIPASEKERFDAFRQMNVDGRVDVFSLRSHNRGIEQSIHFVPQYIIDATCTGEPVATAYRGDDEIDIVRDFRPNIPSCVGKGGYEITDLKGHNDTHFTPDLERIIGSNGALLGYIAESPIGGPFTKNGEPSYGMGLFPFFLSVKPDIISDTDGYIAAATQTLKETIARTQQGVQPQRIIRAHRMSKTTLREVLEELV